VFIRLKRTMGAVVSAAVDINKQSVVNYHVKENHRLGEIIVNTNLILAKFQNRCSRFYSLRMSLQLLRKKRIEKKPVRINAIFHIDLVLQPRYPLCRLALFS